MLQKQKFGLYGSLSKFERAEVLHKYMFYLFYEYKGNVEAVDTQVSACILLAIILYIHYQ